MEDKRGPQTWQELLRQLIENPKEKERILKQANVQPATLTRWIDGISRPRLEKMHSLLRAIPYSSFHSFVQLISTDFPGLLSEHMANQYMPLEPPPEFCMDVLNAYAHTLFPLNSQEFRDLILQRMIRHFDPGCPGLAIRIAQCLWHQTKNKVRSLQVVQEMGSPPWNGNMSQQARLLGTESLAGMAVMELRLRGASRQAQDSKVNPLYWEKHEQSLLAYPLMWQTRVAGCLVVASTQPDAFSEVHHQLIKRYANLMALAFEPDRFFGLKDIALCVMPPYSCQTPLFRQFRQRVLQKVQHQCLSLSEAQDCVWQEIEEELIERVC